jgi:hypothetical protein
MVPSVNAVAALKRRPSTVLPAEQQIPPCTIPFGFGPNDKWLWVCGSGGAAAAPFQSGMKLKARHCGAAMFAVGGIGSWKGE